MREWCDNFYFLNPQGRNPRIYGGFHFWAETTGLDSPLRFAPGVGWEVLYLRQMVSIFSYNYFFRAR